MFDAVIFDLDGTLADTLADIALSMNQALAEFECEPLPLDDYRALLGGGVFALAERASPKSLHDQIDDIVATFRRIYRDNWVGTSKPYPGIVEMLAGLDKPMSVLSNKPQAPAAAVVSALFEDHFVVVQGARPEFPKKPDPTTALAIADQMGIAPSRCAFVGDTPIDIATGMNAGMVAIGVSWGFRPADELRAAGAQRILSHPSELMTLTPT
jgi:phosphoglycolate phosphatase